MKQLNWPALGRYVLLRLTEGGTWRGILLGFAFFGLKFSDTLAGQICTGGVVVAVFVQGALRELNSPVATEIGQARLAAGQSLLSVAQPSIAPSPDVNTSAGRSDNSGLPYVDLRKTP